MENPGVKVLYIALSRVTAKNIMWNDILKDINKRFDIGARPKEVDLQMELPNGSLIMLAGADANPREMEKVLGQKYKLIVIDESASFKQDLHKLVYSHLKPATADYLGTVCMIGTPGNNVTSLFYDVTDGHEPGWSVHKWTAKDNPYMREQWAEEIRDLKDRNPKIVETPYFKQNYLGQWFIDEDALIYKYTPAMNHIAKLPDHDKWHYVLGIDLGYDPDPSAFVICAYNPHDEKLFVVETYKKNKMIISDVVDKIREIQSRYILDRMVIDASAKQAVEEMRQRYALPLQAAEKKDKEGFIELMNTELLLGKIKVVDPEPESNKLITEWRELIWDKKAGKRVEHPNCDNHLADAALYAWRDCYNYAWTPKPAPVRKGSEQEVEQFWEEEAARIEKNKELSFWERDDF